MTDVKPSKKQIQYANDISTMLNIPLPDELDMSVYAIYIAEHKYEFHQERNRTFEYIAKQKDSSPVKSCEPEKALSDKTLTDEDTVAGFLCDQLKDIQTETLTMITLDDARKPIHFHTIASGSLTSVLSDMKEIFAPAILDNAVSIILSSNHLTDDCRPSGTEIDLAKQAVSIGKMLGTKLLDYIIVCNNPEKHYSFKTSRPAMFRDRKTGTLKKSTDTVRQETTEDETSFHRLNPVNHALYE